MIDIIIRNGEITIRENNNDRELSTGQSIDNLTTIVSPFINKRNQGYFEEEAMRMAGIPSQDVTDALQEFENGKKDALFGVTFLPDFVKQGRNNQEELRKYGLTFDIKEYGKSGKIFKYRVFDATFNFCLNYNDTLIHQDILIASLGFNSIEGKMFISQIQGVRGQGEKLSPLKWGRALVEYAIRWARQYKIQEVGILSVYNNKWAQETFKTLSDNRIYPQGMTFRDATHLDFETERIYKETGEKAKLDIHLMPHCGFMTYDMTARRSGFNISENGDYVKRI